MNFINKNRFLNIFRYLAELKQFFRGTGAGVQSLCVGIRLGTFEIMLNISMRRVRGRRLSCGGQTK